MDAGGEHIHHLVIGQEGAHGVVAAAEGLADGDAVGADALVLEGEELARAAQAGLDLIQHQEAVVLVGDLAQALEEALGWDDDAALALDGLHEDGAGVLGHGLLHGLQVAVGHDDEAGGEGAEAAGAVGIGAEAHDGGGAAVEVAVGHDDLGLAVLDALLVVAPLAHGLQCSFHRLGPAVHHQGLLEARQLAELLEEWRELVVAEGAAGEGQGLDLGDHGLADLRVVVALVHGRVGGQEVHVLLAVHIGEVDAFALGADHIERVVVVGAVLVLLLDEGFGPGGSGHGISERKRDGGGHGGKGPF